MAWDGNTYKITKSASLQLVFHGGKTAICSSDHHIHKGYDTSLTWVCQGQV